MRTLTPSTLVLALVVAFAASCGRAATPETRCGHCGMVVDAKSRWRAGLTTARGEERSFDTPKCLLRTLRSAAGRGARDAWVLEYYGGQRQPVTSAFFVTGSDVLGPMGADLVPFADRAAAERFAEDHGNKAILAFSEIDAAVLDAL